MTEDFSSNVQKKLKRLWIGIGLLFAMIVILFVILLNSHLFLYDWVVHNNHYVPFMGDIMLILFMSVVILFFAVMISAVALSN